jgi:Holliday junction resolvase RusA-like endonuclease
VSGSLTHAEMVEALVRVGVPKPQAEREAKRQTIYAPTDTPARCAMPAPRATALVIPWALVVPDNARHGLVRDRIRLTTRYRKALATASALVRQQWRGDPLLDRVQLVVTLHPPDRRRRDIANTLKILADALAGAAYMDDAQIDRLTVDRAEPDPDHPRAVLTVAPLPPK